jgi:hypothetical protein
MPPQYRYLHDIPSIEPNELNEAQGQKTFAKNHPGYSLSPRLKC